MFEFFGGRKRTRTLDPLIKSHHNFIDFAKNFSQLAPKDAIMNQKVTSIFPTDERSVTSASEPGADIRSISAYDH